MSLSERNPFDVLGVSPSAGRPEIERAAQRILAEIALDVAEGEGNDREHEVRQALDHLRDPGRRLEAEVLAAALAADQLSAADFSEAVELIKNTAGAERPESVAVAEEMLWAAIEFPRPHELPPDHNERKRSAFHPLTATPPPVLAFDEVDWAEVVGVPTAAKGTKGGE